MCLGLPVQVVSITPGHALVHGRNGGQTVNTALVGPVQPGDWLLVFLDSARSVIDAGRAAEVNAILDLIQAAMDGDRAVDLRAEPAFALPSAMSADQLAALSGQPATHPGAPR